MKPDTVEQSDVTEQMTEDDIVTDYKSVNFVYKLPSWQMLAASQNSPREQSWVHVADDWQVFAPPWTVSLHIVVPVKDAQS